MTIITVSGKRTTRRRRSSTGTSATAAATSSPTSSMAMMEWSLSNLLLEHEITNPKQQVNIVTDNAKSPTETLVQDVLDHLQWSSSTSSFSMGLSFSSRQTEESVLLGDSLAHSSIGLSTVDSFFCDEVEEVPSSPAAATTTTTTKPKSSTAATVDPFDVDGQTITSCTESSSINTGVSSEVLPETPVAANKKYSRKSDPRWGEKGSDSFIFTSPTPSCYKKKVNLKAHEDNIIIGDDDDDVTTKCGDGGVDKSLDCPVRRTSSHKQRRSSLPAGGSTSAGGLDDSGKSILDNSFIKHLTLSSKSLKLDKLLDIPVRKISSHRRSSLPSSSSSNTTADSSSMQGKRPSRRSSVDNSVFKQQAKEQQAPTKPKSFKLMDTLLERPVRKSSSRRPRQSSLPTSASSPAIISSSIEEEEAMVGLMMKPSRRSSMDSLLTQAKWHVASPTKNFKWPKMTHGSGTTSSSSGPFQRLPLEKENKKKDEDEIEHLNRDDGVEEQQDATTASNSAVDALIEEVYSCLDKSSETNNSSFSSTSSSSASSSSSKKSGTRRRPRRGSTSSSSTTPKQRSKATYSRRRNSATAATTGAVVTSSVLDEKNNTTANAGSSTSRRSMFANTKSKRGFKSLEDE